jgi:uncharacterized protein YbjT (DUF2867 family)
MVPTGVHHASDGHYLTSHQASSVPHFHAKYIAEGLLEKPGLPWVSTRTPVFLDQEVDVNASNAKTGRFVASAELKLSTNSASLNPRYSFHRL